MRTKKAPPPDAAIQRIEEYKARTDPYSPSEQQAELLKRKNDFLEELEGIKNRLGDGFFSVCNEEEIIELPEIKFLDPQRDMSIYKPSLKVAEKESAIFSRLKKAYPPFNIIDDYNDNRQMRCNIRRNYDGRCKKNECDVCMIERDSYFFSEPDLNTVLVPDDVDCEAEEILLQMHIFVYKRYEKKWTEFCRKWHLQPSWNGKLDNFKKHLDPPVKLIQDRIGFRLLRDPAFPIYICIGPWTRKNDIAKVWDEVEEMQKNIYEKQPEKFKTFARDLCWYDLKAAGLSPGKIAKIWEELFPEMIDELSRKPNNPPEFFEADREAYLAGDHSPFKDLIKKSIRNIDRKIKALGARRQPLKPT
ncbi:MAG: hypothetical protein SCM96_00015 [Acidobacteriota bacterium]|nr:hypothetical protein [Acidobacteriota bacterium]